MRRHGRRDERGLSEVVAYILVFTVVLVSLGVVSTFGVTALQEVRDATTANNGEVAMEVLDGDLESVYYGETTGQSTEFALDGASLETGQQVTVDVRVGGTSVGSAPWTFRPIVYRTDETTILYENSMVIREQRDGAVPVTGGLFRHSPDTGSSPSRTVIPVVQTKAPGVGSVSGGTHRVVARRGSDTASVVHSGSPLTVEFELTWGGPTLPERADVWVDRLNERIPASSVPSGTVACAPDTATTSIVCEFETDRLVVSVVEVDYEFE